MAARSDIEYGWGIGSVVMMLVIVACLVFVPLGMGPVGPPPMCVFIIIPVLLAGILIYLSHATSSR